MPAEGRQATRLAFRRAAAGDPHVLSSGTKAVVALDAGGTVRGARPLPSGMFEQPEGITFLPAGELLIAGGGVRAPARLFVFHAPEASDESGR